jgi:hypothetical protein
VQRYLKSDGLIHLWDRLDAILAPTLHRSPGSTPISLSIKKGRLGILSYIASHAYAAASEAGTTLAPILYESLPAGTQLITQYQGFQGIFARNREALLGPLTTVPANVVMEASSKLGRVWLTTIPFQPSPSPDLGLRSPPYTRTPAGEREAHCTHCGETDFSGTRRSVSRGSLISLPE